MSCVLHDSPLFFCENVIPFALSEPLVFVYLFNVLQCITYILLLEENVINIIKVRLNGNYKNGGHCSKRLKHQVFFSRVTFPQDFKVIRSLTKHFSSKFQRLFNFNFPVLENIVHFFSVKTLLWKACFQVNNHAKLLLNSWMYSSNAEIWHDKNQIFVFLALREKVLFL